MLTPTGGVDITQNPDGFLIHRIIKGSWNKINIVADVVVDINAFVACTENGLLGDWQMNLVV